VIDSRTPTQVVETLLQRGFEVCKLPPHPDLPLPVASHPDMLLFFAPDRIFCPPSYALLAENALSRISAHCGKPIQATEHEVGEIYPRDILLNALPIGNRLFCHVRHTARELTELTDYRVVRVRQGYSKCAAIPVGEHALITSDPSIAKAARTEGLDVLQIACGNVVLKGYDSGLIGGAASFAPYGGTDEILFCGALSTHPCAELIRDFCISHKKNPLSLSVRELIDVGTIFLL